MSVDYTSLLHSEQSAALWRAIALRRLHNYRAARENAKMHGDDLAGLIEPPKYPELSDAYIRLIEGLFCESVNSANVARSTLDLIAAIAQDQQFTHIFEVGPVVSIERDVADLIRLIEALSGWVNKQDIAEVVAQERETRQ